MSTPTSFRELSAPVAALALLMAGHPELPAPDIQVTPIYPDWLRLAFHGEPFDVWLKALGISPDSVAVSTQAEGATRVRKAETRYGGAEIELTEYTDVEVGEPR